MSAAQCGASAKSFVVSDHGLSVAARVAGTGRPLLLLNGLSRTMDSWVHLRAALTDRMIIMFDAPGVGASRIPMIPYTMAMVSNLAMKVLDAVGVKGADVVGYSHGGAIAQQMSVDHPERVGRLVLISTSCGIGGVPGDGWGLARSMMRQPGDHAPTNGSNPLSLMWQVAAYSAWSSLPFLSSIKAPTLVIHGRNDRIVPLANARLLATRIPGAGLKTLDAGHDLQAYRPAGAVARLIDPFLSEGTSVR